jgi:hypothetical protein
MDGQDRSPDTSCFRFVPIKSFTYLTPPAAFDYEYFYRKSLIHLPSLTYFKVKEAI